MFIFTVSKKRGSAWAINNLDACRQEMFQSRTAQALGTLAVISAKDIDNNWQTGQMKELIQKYFSDPTSDPTYAEKNVFNSPADIKTLAETQKQLNIKFPQDYIDFLLITNGYDGRLGDSYVQFIKVEDIGKYTEMYCGEFFPWTIYIGADGGNEMFVLDKRESQLQFGIMPFIGEDQDFIPLGPTFEEFAKHLYFNDYWDIKK